jgi:predicted kinase
MADSASNQLKQFLTTPSDGPKVILLCGIAGAGKSTSAKSIAKNYGFKRLSIDQTLFETHGLCGVDYERAVYEDLLDQAERMVMEKLLEHLRQKENVVLDRSYWSLDDRKACYRILELEGVRDYRLVYLRAGKEFL